MENYNKIFWDASDLNQLFKDGKEDIIQKLLIKFLPKFTIKNISNEKKKYDLEVEYNNKIIKLEVEGTKKNSGLGFQWQNYGTNKYGLKKGCTIPSRKFNSLYSLWDIYIKFSPNYDKFFVVIKKFLDKYIKNIKYDNVMDSIKYYNNSFITINWDDVDKMVKEEVMIIDDFNKLEKLFLKTFEIKYGV